MVVDDGKPSFNIVLQGASRGVLVIEEETHDAVGAADGDVIGVEIGSPNRAGKHLQQNMYHHKAGRSWQRVDTQYSPTV